MVRDAAIMILVLFSILVGMGLLFEEQEQKHRLQIIEEVQRSGASNINIWF